jgi:hypothetical protein
MTSPRENPLGTPAKTPSNTLLKNFRATLEARWNEFDTATMKEANEQASTHPLWFMANVAERRNQDGEFQRAKKTFSEAQSMLATVSNDTELKANAQILAKVEETLKWLTDYLASIKPEEKSKAHNIILAKTTADLAGFKAELTGKVEDKKSADEATAAEQAIPRKAVVAAATWWGIIASAEAKTAIDEVKNEFKKELGPWGMIFQWVKDVSPKDVAEQVKSISKKFNEKKWMEDPVDKFFAMIELFFLKWQIKKAGMDLGAHMTADELRLAGIEGKATVPQAQSENADATNKKVEERKYMLAKVTFGKLLFTKEKEWAAALFEQPNFQKMTYGEIKDIYTAGKKEWIAKKLGLEPQKDAVVWDMIEAIWGWKTSQYIVKEFSKKHPEKNIKSQSIKDILIATANEFGAIITLKNIDLSDPTSLLDGMQFDLDSSGELVWPAAEKVKQHVSRETLDYMLIQWSGYKFTDTKTNIDIERKKGAPKLSESSLAEMQKIFEFGDRFKEKLLSDPKLNLGYGSSFKERFESPGISYQFLVLLYGSLGWNADFQSMTPVGKLAFYSGIITVAGWLDSMDRGSVAAGFLKKLLTGDTPEIDPEVKKLGEDTGISLIWKVGDGVWETVKTVIWVGRESPTAAIAAVALLWFWWAARKKWHNFRMH